MLGDRRHGPRPRRHRRRLAAPRGRAGRDAAGPLRREGDRRPPRGRATPPFHYHDKGNLATIGRANAVADVRGLHLSGLAAWVTWLFVHIFYLIGFENRVLVLVRWAGQLLHPWPRRAADRPPAGALPPAHDAADHQPDGLSRRV